MNCKKITWFASIWSSFAALNLKFSKENPIFSVFCIFLNKESSRSHDFPISGTFEKLSTTKKKVTWPKNHMILKTYFFLSTTTTKCFSYESKFILDSFLFPCISSEIFKMSGRQHWFFHMVTWCTPTEEYRLNMYHRVSFYSISLVLFFICSAITMLHVYKISKGCAQWL